MQKWEYLWVETYPDYVVSVNGVNVDAEKIKKKGEPLPEWYHEEIPLFLNRVGRDGWELVLESSCEGSRRRRLIFKRPVVDGPVEGHESI